MEIRMPNIIEEKYVDDINSKKALQCLRLVLRSIHRIIESHHGWGWKEHLKVIWSKPLLKESHIELTAKVDFFLWIPWD